MNHNSYLQKIATLKKIERDLFRNGVKFLQARYNAEMLIFGRYQDTKSRKSVVWRLRILF